MVHVMPVIVSEILLFIIRILLQMALNESWKMYWKTPLLLRVNKDGEIEVEGKKVQKVMVKGRFLDGDTNWLPKNIPADALDKIQVLRNYNEVSNLKGLEK